jgi:hypothetical protein
MVKALKLGDLTGGQEMQGGQVTTDDGWDAQVVAFRYAEYCVTAPLLFLAIVCLFTVDAPAWIYLSGYFLLMACNLFGMALHYSIMSAWDVTGKPEESGWKYWITQVLLTGSW